MLLLANLIAVCGYGGVNYKLRIKVLHFKTSFDSFLEKICDPFFFLYAKSLFLHDVAHMLLISTYEPRHEKTSNVVSGQV